MWWLLSECECECECEGVTDRVCEWLFMWFIEWLIRLIDWRDWRMRPVPYCLTTLLTCSCDLYAACWGWVCDELWTAWYMFVRWVNSLLVGVRCWWASCCACAVLFSVLSWFWTAGAYTCKGTLIWVDGAFDNPPLQPPGVVSGGRGDIQVYNPPGL